MTKRFVRRLFASILIIASLVVAAIPTTEVNADVSVRSEFQMDGSTLVKYTGTASTVSVPDSVKVIGEEAFANNSTLTTIVIPDSVKEISYAAFSGCNHLTTLSIPSSVETLGTAAFCNCTALNSVIIGSGLRKMGTGVFTGCPSLSLVSFFNNEHFVCEDGVIYDKDKETLILVLKGRKGESYTMPGTVKEIYPYAFYGCKTIKTLILSYNLEDIPAYAFSYCYGLKSITIPYSVKLIDMKAFENCANLSDVEIPSSVTFIHKTAFDGCSKLNIIAPDNSYARNWFKDFDRSIVAIIEDEDEDTKTDDKKDESFEIEGLIGETVIVARQAVFFIDSSAFTVYSGKKVKDKDYSEVVAQMEEVLQAETHGKGLSLPKFTVLDDTISGKAYYGDTSFDSFTFPSNVTKIGDFAFARTNLEFITIPYGVTDIGYGAFYHCDELEQILVPNTVTNIGPSAFAKTRMLENWMLYGSDDFLVMGDGILVAYRGSDSIINIPDTVKQIGPEVFKDNTKITEVYLPDSVVRICEDAFYGCSRLTNIAGGMNLSVIEDRAFAGCPLETIRLVDTVTCIGAGAFDYTDTNLSYSERVAYFYGDKLPKVRYNRTTTRLTNDDFRVDSLEGVNVAIINSAKVSLEGTVLDPEYSGFSGLICVITAPNTDYSNGTIRIVGCTLTSEEANDAYIPSTAYVFGKGYNFIDEELFSVLDAARNGAYEKESAVDNMPVSLVNFEGSDDNYRLYINESVVEKDSILSAYERIYGEEFPRNTKLFDIALYEENNDIPLSKFGKQTLKISYKLPSNISTTNLHVIGIDEYEQLEDFAYNVIGVEDDGLYVEFEISHTGTYGIYSYAGDSVISLLGKDSSPDTGDYIHPKWYLSLGLLLLGIAMFVIKGKR